MKFEDRSPTLSDRDCSLSNVPEEFESGCNAWIDIGGKKVNSCHVLKYAIENCWRDPWCHEGGRNGTDLRDEFAKAALTGAISALGLSIAGDGHNIDRLARYSWLMADAMLRARKEPPDDRG